MRRSPLRRRSPMRPSGRRSKYRLRLRDIPYLLFVKTLPCVAAAISAEYPCEGPIEADHAGERALGQKAPDNTAIPLCQYHHRCRHDFSGPFREWPGERMRVWLDHWIKVTRALAAARGFAATREPPAPLPRAVIVNRTRKP